MSQCYIEKLIMVKSYYPVARKTYLSPSFVAGFEKDSMIGLAKALSSWFVVRWASWSTKQNVFTYSKAISGEISSKTIVKPAIKEANNF